MRAENEDNRATIECEDADRSLVAHLHQEAGHLLEIVPQSFDDTRGTEIETLEGIARVPQVGDRVLVDQAGVTRVGIRCLQVPLAVVVLIRMVVEIARRNPAQRVDRHAELVLQIVEGRLDHRIRGEVVPASEACRLKGHGPDRGLVPTVVPGDSDRSGSRLQAVGVTLHRVFDGTDGGGINRASSEDIGPRIEAVGGLQAEAAVREQSRCGQIPIRRTDRAVAVDIGDPRGKQHGRLRIGQTYPRGGGRHRCARGRHEPPPGRGPRHS